jgi:hypothetical protein
MNSSDTIRNIRNKLLEATSSYEDRVLQVAQKVMKREDLTSSQLDEEIEYVSKELEITEYKLKKKRAWKVFVTDVKAKMRALGWKAKRTSSPREPKVPDSEYKRIARELIGVIGDAFPADPSDACSRWAKSNGYSTERFWFEVWPKVKKFFKKETGFDDVYDYHDELQKQYDLDNPETEEVYVEK